MRVHPFNHLGLCVCALALALGTALVAQAQGPTPAPPQAPVPAAAPPAVPVSPEAQALGTQFEFVISVADGKGQPVAGLERSEIKMSENGIPAEILDVTPYPVPVQLTIAVDNGPASADALSHYRSGLAGLVKALPPGVEVTLLTTSPQPRAVVRASMDQQRVLRAVNEFAPEAEAPRFTDTIVEFSQRMEKDLKDAKEKVLPYSPILLIVSTTAAEASSYQMPAIEKAMGVIANNRARVMIAMTTTKVGSTEAVEDMNSGRQALIGIPLTKGTRGRYEALAQSSRLQTLLPEFGKNIGDTHRRQVAQVKVTIERPAEVPSRAP